MPKFERGGFEGASVKEAEARRVLRQTCESKMKQVGAPSPIAYRKATQTAGWINKERLYQLLEAFGLKWDRRYSQWRPQ